MSPVHTPTPPGTEPNSPQQTILLGKSEMIVGYLQNLALPSLGNRQLSERDYEAWDRLLAPYTKDQIAFAFESWVRNNKGFPQVSVIIALANTHVVANNSKIFHGCGRCYDGWLYSRDNPGRYRLGVKRCECFTRWCEQQKVA